ncbi:MAG: hypothetical protein M3432_07900, partial [Chloroflexota bacterium]|nr:hypothetical protein [Chloroflexota bacterium]
SRGEFLQVKELQRQGRIQAFGEADYSAGSHTAMWLEAEVERICDAIVRTQQRALVDRIGPPARHIAEDRRSSADLERPEQAIEELAAAKPRQHRRPGTRKAGTGRIKPTVERAMKSKPAVRESPPDEVPLPERLTLVRADTDEPAEPGPAEPTPRSIRGLRRLSGRSGSLS